MSFTTRLTSLILQQYKIGFKVELKKKKNTKVIVVINGMKISFEDVFSISRKANGANNEYRENSKTVMPTATTERWTLSFCIVSYIFELFDSQISKINMELSLLVQPERNLGVTVRGCS